MARPVSFSASSRIEWKVKNIFSGGIQESEEFPFKGSLWRLALEKWFGTIGISLKETKRKKVSDDFTSRVFIVDQNRSPQFLKEQLCTVHTENYFCCSIWRMEETGLRLKRDSLSTDDIVSFVCILTPKTTKEGEIRGNKSLETSVNAQAGGRVHAHFHDFRRLLYDSALSDVTLKCGERTIPAHRLILSARSEVFAAMLRTDMSENRRGIIEISDMEPPILEQFLQFLYSCKLPDVSMDAATQLYEAADEYGVESLKEECSAFMMENLTERNACCILLLADAHSDSDLKGGVVSFIVGTKLFQRDEVWLKFCEDHPKLANEVLNSICKTLFCLV